MIETPRYFTQEDCSAWLYQIGQLYLGNYISRLYDLDKSITRTQKV